MRTAILVLMFTMGCQVDAITTTQHTEETCTTAPPDIAPCTPGTPGCTVVVREYDTDGNENPDRSLYLDAETAARINAWCTGGGYTGTRECCLSLDAGGMYCAMCNPSYGCFISYYPGLHR